MPGGPARPVAFAPPPSSPRPARLSYHFFKGTPPPCLPRSRPGPPRHTPAPCLPARARAAPPSRPAMPRGKDAVSVSLLLWGYIALRDCLLFYGEGWRMLLHYGRIPVAPLRRAWAKAVNPCLRGVNMIRRIA